MPVGARGVQERTLDPDVLSHLMWVLALNLGPSKEQYTLLTAELFLEQQSYFPFVCFRQRLMRY